MPLSFWLGVDTGGTFTDFVLLGDGEPRIHKVLSTPAAPEQAILQGIHELGLDAAMAAGELAIVHGTTVATNAALEGKGARTVFVTNSGIEDILRIGRQNRAELYNLTPAPQSGVLTELPCEGATCRLDASGQEIQALNDTALDDLVARVQTHAPNSVAICLLFSYLNGQQEQRIADALQRVGISVSTSHSIIPTRGEYERGMATWLNAWLSPRVAAYLQRLEQATTPAPLAIMQSHGGTIAAHQARELAVNLLLSGPAGGLAAAQRLGEQLGQPQLMTFDMGGTSTDVALLDGQIRLTQQGHIGPYPVAVPMVDMHTIGAGGGSLAYVDEAGLLHVGPQSAGADPGPACYGRGGHQVTVTDANVVLGRLQPDFALGGSLKLDVAAAERAMESLGKQLGMDTLTAAEGVLALANEHMTQALRVISIQKGHDPEDFALMSFGGAGGLHVCALADNLGMRRAIVPQRAGVLSAEGLVYAPRKRELLKALPEGLSDADCLAEIHALQQQGTQELQAEGVAAEQIGYQVYLDMCYRGQSSVLQIPWTDDTSLREQAFHQAHEQRFGHRLGLAVQQVNLRVQCQAKQHPPTTPALPTQSSQPLRTTLMPGLATEVSIYQREQLGSGQCLQGPALIAEAVGTTWLAPGWQARVDPLGHLLLERS
ncbi:hydantoinase/oxoprolinase family protein [Alcanivorax sp. S6407]|uniref:hydantoinase/oxoprolinase family protein n=1 Tax=Alcanivorax sp. S6407 TaxID=2926424 RepID=UPI001FF329FE|nr:hydantoinase/oxoprolinase family protein [Alcanivorax sp. S6407]MCK0154655.1 hydantoinase/oxoprolinase family protein [Alcanivorax sp. S6407]